MPEMCGAPSAISLMATPSVISNPPFACVIFSHGVQDVYMMRTCSSSLFIILDIEVVWYVVLSSASRHGGHDNSVTELYSSESNWTKELA
jgi:hypothetical protein